MIFFLLPITTDQTYCFVILVEIQGLENHNIVRVHAVSVNLIFFCLPANTLCNKFKLHFMYSRDMEIISQRW
jgi:hypothetical protein